MSRRTRTKWLRSMHEQLPDGTLSKKVVGYRPAQERKLVEFPLPDGRIALVALSAGQVINMKKWYKRYFAGEAVIAGYKTSETPTDGLAVLRKGLPDVDTVKEENHPQPESTDGEPVAEKD